MPRLEISKYEDKDEKISKILKKLTNTNEDISKALNIVIADEVCEGDYVDALNQFQNTFNSLVVGVYEGIDRKLKNEESSYTDNYIKNDK